MAFYGLVKRSPRPERVVIRILKHANTQPEFWRRDIMEDKGIDPLILLACTKVDWIRQDPVVRGPLVTRVRISQKKGGCRSTGRS